MQEGVKAMTSLILATSLVRFHGSGTYVLSVCVMHTRL